MAEPRGMRAGQLEGVALIVVPGSQIDRAASPAALGHAEHVLKKAQALCRPRGEHLKMGEMGHVHDRFIVHDVLSRCDASAAVEGSSVRLQPWGNRGPAGGISSGWRASPATPWARR